MTTPRRIVCAALRHSNGAIICSPRHFDPLMHAQIKQSAALSHRAVDTGWKTAEQGFVNTHGEFLTREDALHVALACGQRIRRCGGDETQLFSENLY